MCRLTTKRLLHSLVLASILFLSACATQRSAAIQQEWSVLLAASAPADHLVVHYQSPFSLESCQRTSRSENRWSIVLPYSKRAQRKILREMAKDTLIVDVKKLSQEPNEPTNNTNEGHSKSKPIRNQ